MTEQGEQGNWDYNYRSVIGVFIANFRLPVKAHKLLHDIELKDRESSELFSDRLRWIYIELPEFDKKKPEDCETDFERWIFILKNMKYMTALPFTTISDVYDKLERISRVDRLSREDRSLYEREMKYYRDTYNKWTHAVSTTREETKKEIAVKMKERGLDLDTIMAVTGLTADEVGHL